MTTNQTCTSCGRESLTAEPLCADCQPMNWTWPTDTFLSRRLNELREQNGNQTSEPQAKENR